MAGMVAMAAAAAVLALDAERRLLAARERLLAGDLASARGALEKVRWPGSAAAKAAGLALVRTALGEAAATPALAPLAWFEPEWILTGCIDRGELKAAQRLAGLLHGAGLPQAALYEAALRFDAGDLDGARAAMREPTFDPGARELGRRLERALREREAKAAPLLFDRTGALVGVLGEGGALLPLGAVAPFVEQAFARASLSPPPVPASGALRTTLDLELSRLAWEALGDRRGSIVLLDPRGGGVLAAVTDPLTAIGDPQAAFDQQREPASIAKLLTAAAAYRSELDADASIRQMRCTGVERYDGRPLWCPSPSGQLAGLDHAMAVSCNVAFANLAVSIGAPRLLEEYRRWGFDAPPTSLLGAAGRIERPPATLRELADLAIGLENSSLSPLHAALIAAVVANEGRLVEPRLVSGGCGWLGLAETAGPPAAVREVVAPALARRLAISMRAVLAYGTGWGLEPAGLSMAMKTGTAALPGHGYHVNYVGFAPAERPAVAFCIRVTGQRSAPRIHQDAREIAGRLFAGLAARRATLSLRNHAAGEMP